MNGVIAVVLHHAEAVDPALVDWLRHQIDVFLGLAALIIVIALAIIILGLPLGVGYAVLRYRRAAQHEGNRIKLPPNRDVE